MPTCQSFHTLATDRPDQRLPDLWLLTDLRNDHLLERALRCADAPIALVFRHYHLPAAPRHERYGQLARIARAQGHLVILAGPLAQAHTWRADGMYGAPDNLPRTSAGLLRIATAHDMAEIGRANRLGADAVMLSPVFPTRSHPGARPLGRQRFRALARHAQMPVIALGGMTPHNARRLHWQSWAAIDGFSSAPHHHFP